MTDVWRLYESFAEAYDRERGRALMERSYLTDMISRLREGADILDLGCGGGEPIARFLVEGGFHVTGVDAAPAMIAMCRHRFPDATWIEADMRTLDLGRRYDAIVAWDSFFHLDGDEQRAMFDIFAGHCAPDGLLLFTSGPEAGEAIGDFFGHPLFHASLDADEYESLLKRLGFAVLRHRAEDPDCGRHTVWLAQAIGDTSASGD
jgi:SAM-dependent methyltransferase